MLTENSTTDIRNALYSSGIVSSPLDSDSLRIIEKYYDGSINISCSESKLANLEYAVSSLRESAQQSQNTASSTALYIAGILRDLTDLWYSRGLLRDFTFSFSDNDCEFMKKTFSHVVTSVNIYIKKIESASLSTAECATQMRACSASAAELSYESRMAELAYILKNDVTGRQRARSLHLRAHATVRECERMSLSYLGFTRVCAGTAAMLNKTIAGAAKSLRINIDTDEKINVISPMGAVRELNNAISNIERSEFNFR